MFSTRSSCATEDEPVPRSRAPVPLEFEHPLNSPTPLSLPHGQGASSPSPAHIPVPTYVMGRRRTMPLSPVPVFWAKIAIWRDELISPVAATPVYHCPTGASIKLSIG